MILLLLCLVVLFVIPYVNNPSLILEGSNAFSVSEEQTLSSVFQVENDINSIQNLVTGKVFNNIDPESQLTYGYYLVNEKYPLVVAPVKVTSKIAVVLPLMNIGLKEFVSDHFNDGVDSNIELELVEESGSMRGLISLLDTLGILTDVTFIADSDLQNWELIEEVDLLIILGPSAFWSKEMKTNFNEFLLEGGNVLIISDTFQDNYCGLIRSAKEVALTQDSEQTTLISKWKVENKFVDLFSYCYGGKPDALKLNRSKDESPNESLPDLLSLETTSEMGLNLIYQKELMADGELVSTNFYYSRNALYNESINTSGIFKLDFVTNSSVVIFSSEQALAPHNINKNKELFKVFDYMIKLLLIN